MLVTMRPEIAQRARIMRLHGIDRDAFDRYTARRPSWYYEVVAPGYKYNMTDIAAAPRPASACKSRCIHRHAVRNSRSATTPSSRDLPLVLPPRPAAADRQPCVAPLCGSAGGRPAMTATRWCRRCSRPVSAAAFITCRCTCSRTGVTLIDWIRDTSRNSQRLYERGFSLPIYTRMTDERPGSAWSRRCARPDRVMKRLLDIVAATVGLVAALADPAAASASPCDWTRPDQRCFASSGLAATAVRLTMLKFRTMRVAARTGRADRLPLEAIRRVTRAGACSAAASSTSCRSCSTCLRGDMSLVGPRPEVRDTWHFIRPMRGRRCFPYGQGSPTRRPSNSGTKSDCSRARGEPGAGVRRGDPAAQDRSLPPVRAVQQFRR